MQERIKTRLDAARARGKLSKRKKMLATDPKMQTVETMHKDYNMSIDNTYKTLKISRAIFYRYLSVEKK